jgi:single-strand selective monofunctional uracil DNA glycosylase
MAQTGVPFGEVASVTSWLRITAEVQPPDPEHPKRPVTGFDCRRSEVSGRRVWGWARQLFGTADRFFERFFIANYCPLLFLEASGRNRTPDRLPAAERRRLEACCDRALRDTVHHLRPTLVIGLGLYATRSAARALDGSGVTVARVLHPSPASPAANRGWAEQVTRQLRELGVELPKRPSSKLKVES